MSIINISTRLARPSAVVASAMTDAERIALSIRDLALVLDPGEIATEYAALTCRDRIGGRPMPVVGASIGAIGGRPGLTFAAQGAYVMAPYSISPSYFLACAVNLTSQGDTNMLLISFPSTSQRLGWMVSTSLGLRLDHGTGIGQSVSLNGASAVKTGPQVLWASYDAESHAAAIGVNAVTAIATGTIATDHDAPAKTVMYGGADPLRPEYAITGVGGPMLIADRWLGGDADYQIRAALLAYLAEYAGTTLGA